MNLQVLIDRNFPPVPEKADEWIGWTGFVNDLKDDIERVRGKIPYGSVHYAAALCAVLWSKGFLRAPGEGSQVVDLGGETQERRV